MKYLKNIQTGAVIMIVPQLVNDYLSTREWIKATKEEYEATFKDGKVATEYKNDDLSKKNKR